MKEKTLLRLSLICSLIGILLLFIISHNLSVNETTISRIDQTDYDSSTKLTGIVDDVKNLGSATIISIAQLEKMTVVVFENVSLQRGDYIEVSGKIQEYNGKPELIADKIILK